MELQPFGLLLVRDLGPDEEVDMLVLEVIASPRGHGVVRRGDDVSGLEVD